MSAQTDTLPPGLIAPLRIVSTVDCVEPAIIAKELGRSCGPELREMLKRGLVVTEAALRRDGKRATLYSISTRGRVALAAASAAAPSPPAPRTYDVVPTKALPREETWTPKRGEYTGAELLPYDGRPGAMDATSLPSRMNNRLHYRDGRVAHIPEGKQP